MPRPARAPARIPRAAACSGDGQSVLFSSYVRSTDERICMLVRRFIRSGAARAEPPLRDLTQARRRFHGPGIQKISGPSLLVPLFFWNLRTFSIPASLAAMQRNSYRVLVRMGSEVIPERGVLARVLGAELVLQ